MNVIDSYIAAWNAETAEERQQLLQSCMVQDAVYIDPHAPEPIQGVEAMQSLIETFRSRFDHKLIVDSAIDNHHNVFRLSWRLKKESGEELSCGLMVGDFNDDTEQRKLKRIVQFVNGSE